VTGLARLSYSVMVPLDGTVAGEQVPWLEGSGGVLLGSAASLRLGLHLGFIAGRFGDETARALSPGISLSQALGAD
jgi:hypothetical protein